MKSFTKGFTIIELLVTVAIIAILSSIVLANFGQARAKSRDGKRVSDINQIQLALTLFFDRCDVYPASPLLLADNGGGSCPTGITLGTFIGKIPLSPSNTAYNYAVSPDLDDYHIGIQLEVQSPILQDKANIDSASKSPTWTGGFNATGALWYDVGSK